MTRLGSIGVAALAVLGAPTQAAATPSLDLPIEQHVLANGMHLIFAPDATLGDVTVVVRYDVGTADDPAGKDGLAHVVEHLMFSGSKHVPKGEHYRWIDRIGGTALNATTHLDDTRYFVTLPPEALPLVLWLESDRMGFLAGRIDEEALVHECATVEREP